MPSDQEDQEKADDDIQDGIQRRQKSFNEKWEHGDLHEIRRDGDPPGQPDSLRGPRFGIVHADESSKPARPIPWPTRPASLHRAWTAFVQHRIDGSSVLHPKARRFNRHVAEGRSRTPAAVEGTFHAR